MDLLRSEAQAEFCKMAFEPLDQPFEVAQIISQRFTEVDDDLVLESKRLSATELNFFATETGSSADTDISPSLKLVRFPYMVGQKLFVRWEVFHHVFRSFMLEPLMLRMALRNSASFYELGQCVSSNGHEVLRYYLDMRAYIILWSYNTGTAATRAIVLTRTSKGSKRAYSNFYAKLEIYRSLVYHPTFLPFIAVMNVLIYVDEFLKEEVKELGNAERETGFSYFYRHVPTPDYTAEQELLVFSNMSRVASGTLVGIADMTGHLQTAQVVLDYILNDAVQWNRDICQNTKFQIEKCEKSIIEVSVFLRSQLDSTFRYMEFIKERARNQLTVVRHRKSCFAMLLTQASYSIFSLEEMRKRISISQKLPGRIAPL